MKKRTWVDDYEDSEWEAEKLGIKLGIGAGIFIALLFLAWWWVRL